jgi:hypothetical protein
MPNDPMRQPLIDFEDASAKSEVSEFTLAVLDMYFDDEKNPLYAWEAYALCRKEKRDIPGWVHRYFEQVAERLLQLGEGDKKLSRRASAEIYEALGMKVVPHSRNVFDRYQIAKRKREIWARVRFLHRGESKLPLVEAFKQVFSEIREKGMKIPLDMPTIKKAYYDIDREFSEDIVYEKPRRGPKRKKRG